MSTSIAFDLLCVAVQPLFKNAVRRLPHQYVRLLRSFGASGDTAVRRRGKTILEADRRCYAEEEGYKVVLGKLEPLEASPMNDVLVGIPT